MKTAFNSDFCLHRLREINPLIHNITNLVSAHFTANGLLAIGASPIMADCMEEVAELAGISQALVLNFGTPSNDLIEAMVRAGKAANQARVPVVLDPVAAGVTALRCQTVKYVLDTVRVQAIRGNAAEMAYLADVAWNGKGVDVGKGDANLGEIAEKVAKKYACVAILTGQEDVIADDSGSVFVLRNGTPLLPKITASGCLLSAIVGAFLAANQENPLWASIEACATYAIAAEKAAKGLSNTQYGHFMIALLDALGEITSDEVAQKMHLTRI